MTPKNGSSPLVIVITCSSEIRHTTKKQRTRNSQTNHRHLRHLQETACERRSFGHPSSSPSSLHQANRIESIPDLRRGDPFEKDEEAEEEGSRAHEGAG